MTQFDRIMEDVLTEHADVWEALAKGSTALEREVAFVLRSIVAEIEGPHPANSDSVREALRWCLDVLGVEKAETPRRVYVPLDSDPGLTDNTTWVPDGGWRVWSGTGCTCSLTAGGICPMHGYAWSWDGSTTDANGHVQ